MQTSSGMEGGGTGSGGPGPGPQASPKRAREGREEAENAAARDSQPLTLAALQQALQINQQQITESIQESIAGIGQRVSQVEVNMEEHVKRTTELLGAMTDRHVHIEQSVNKVVSGHEELVRRMELLEGKFATASFSTTTSTRTDSGGPETAPRPAIVVGGWDNDQSAEDTLGLVKQHLQDLRCNLDLAEAFVPGLRRGFAIVPISPRRDEAIAEYRRRIREALQRVREAKIVTGTRPQGGDRHLWAAMSESPERRRRAQFAGKVKRLLEESGDRSKLEVEFGTGNVWYCKARIASAVLMAPEEADKAGVGWLSLPTLARQLGTSLSSLTDRWGELKKGLN